MSTLDKVTKFLGNGNQEGTGKMKFDSIKNQIQPVISQLSKQIESLKDQGGDVSAITPLLEISQNLMGQLKETPVEPPAGIEEVVEDRRRFVSYFARLEESRSALSDPAQMARLAHDAHVEHTYLRILNGESPGTTDFEPIVDPECPGKIDLNRIETGPQPFRDETTNLLNEKGQKLLAAYLYTDAKRQQEVYLLTLQMEQLMKLMYLQQETELLDSMLEQQDALVRGLSDWSSYLDQQTQEYVEMYDKMDSLISTQRRKSSFTVRDIQSLDQWTYWSQVVFWILLASCGMMVVVHNYSAVNKTAKAIDAGIGRARAAIGA